MSNTKKIPFLCVGATNSGKTLLLRKLQGRAQIDGTTSSVPTIGSTLYKLKFRNNNNTVLIRELGGSVAPLWHHYCKNVTKIMVVVDASNLCQISASGVLLYRVLTEPDFQNTQILIVLSKMDMSYRQMRNEAVLILQIDKLKREVPQKIQVVEFSAIRAYHRLELLHLIRDCGRYLETDIQNYNAKISSKKLKIMRSPLAENSLSNNLITILQTYSKLERTRYLFY